MTEKTSLPESLTSLTPWEKSSSPIWLSTHYTLRRNYSRYRFPQKISESEAKQVLNRVKDSLLSSSQLNKPVFLSSEEMPSTDREYLVEHFNFLDGFGPVGKNQGFIFDASQQFLGLINMGDHFVLQWTDLTQAGQKAWETLSKIEEGLASSLEYAYAEKFGYLTSSTAHCGTGLTLQAFLHLPAILHMGSAAEAFEKDIEEDVFHRELGEAEMHYVGDLVILQNKYTLGLTEEAMIQSLLASASKLKITEEALRSHIQKTDNFEMKDKVCRAFGLLSHSYQLQTPEVLSALSFLKLGVNLGWVVNISNEKISEMFFRCRRAHIQSVKKASQNDIPHERAEYLHSSLKSAQLTI